jgi:hypothetical protein
MTEILEGIYILYIFNVLIFAKTLSYVELPSTLLNVSIGAF